MKKNKQNTVAKYRLFKSEEVDIWTTKGKFDLASELSQADLKYLFDEGYINKVYKLA